AGASHDAPDQGDSTHAPGVRRPVTVGGRRPGIAGRPSDLVARVLRGDRPEGPTPHEHAAAVPARTRTVLRPGRRVATARLPRLPVHRLPDGGATARVRPEERRTKRVTGGEPSPPPVTSHAGCRLLRTTS